VNDGKLTLPPPGKRGTIIYQRPYEEFSPDSNGYENRDFFNHDIWDIVPTVNEGAMLRFLKYFCVDKSIYIPVLVYTERMLKEHSFELLLLCDSVSPGFIDSISADLLYHSILDMIRVSSRNRFLYIRDVLKRRPDIISKARSPGTIQRSSKNIYSMILELGNRWIHKQTYLDEVLEVFRELYRLGETTPFCAFASWMKSIKSLHSMRINCSDFVAFLMEIPDILSDMRLGEYQSAMTFTSINKISSIVQRGLISSFRDSQEVPLSAVINDTYPPKLMVKLVSDPTLRKWRYKLNCKYGEDDVATFLRCCGETASISDFMPIFDFFEELCLASEITNRVIDVVNRCSLGVLKALFERGFPFFGSMDSLNFSSLAAVIASDRASKGFRDSLIKEKVDFLSQMNPDWPPPGQVDLGRFLTEVGDWSKITAEDTVLYLDYFLEKGAVVNTDDFIAAMDHRYIKALWNWFESHRCPINQSIVKHALTIAKDNGDPTMLVRPHLINIIIAANDTECDLHF